MSTKARGWELGSLIVLMKPFHPGRNWDAWFSSPVMAITSTLKNCTWKYLSRARMEWQSLLGKVRALYFKIKVPLPRLNFPNSIRLYPVFIRGGLVAILWYWNYHDCSENLYGSIAPPFLVDISSYSSLIPIPNYIQQRTIHNHSRRLEQERR